MTPSLLHQLITRSALLSPDAIALKSNLRTATYAQLAEEVGRFANGILAAGIGRGERVGIYLDKRLEPLSLLSAHPLLARFSFLSIRC